MINSILPNNIYTTNLYGSRKNDLANSASNVRSSYIGAKSYSADNVLYVSFRGTNSPSKQHGSFKQNPQVAIVDFFDDKCIDISGDGVPDMSHKDMVKLIANATFPEAKTVCFNLGESSFVNYDKLAGVMDALADRIKEKHDIDAVNLSAYVPTTIPLLKDVTEIPELNAENINLYRDKLREWIKNPTFPEQIGDMKNSSAMTLFLNLLKATNNAISSIEKVTEQGVPVYISAGNSGSDNINYLCLAKGSISVGANDIKGNVASYSANHSLVSMYEQGSFEILPVLKDGKILGYNVTGDGKVQVPYDSVSHGPSIVNKFNGKIPKEVLADDSIFKKLNDIKADYSKRVSYLMGTLEEAKEFENYLFPVEKLAESENKSDKELEGMKRVGDYCTFDFSNFFKLDDEGKFVYCPAGRPSKNAVNKLWGTSFSCPKAMMQDLKHTFSAII